MLPDNRLRFDPTLIDFATSVGETGQAHDDFPGPNQQPRYDWLRMWYIALLANQSSYDEPTQYREGTLWFDLITLTLKARRNDQWVPLSDVVAVDQQAGVVTTLSQWFARVELQLTGAAPESNFSGICNSDHIVTIPVPDSLQGIIDSSRMRPFVYINGLLIDPRDSEFFTVATVQLLNGVQLNSGDRFTVLIKNITSQTFHVPDVVIP